MLALGWSLVGLASVLVSLPLWFPLALRPLARKADASYSTYKREGYGRLRLSNFAYSNGPVVFHAESVESFVPTLWLDQLALGKRNKTIEPFVRLEGWGLTIGPSKAGSHASNVTNSSTFTNALQVANVLQVLQKWLPTATVSNGSIRASGTIVKVPAITWTRGKLWAEVEYPPTKQTATINANVRAPNRYTMRLQSDSLQSDLNVELTPTASGLNARGSGSWRDKPIRFSAQFGRQGTFPEYAEVEAPEFEFPAELAGIKGIGEIAGSASARWDRGNFTVAAHARSQGQAQTDVAQFRFDLDAAGSTNFARFHLSGSDVGNSRIRARSLVLDGMLRWPWLELTNASAVLMDGSVCAVAAKIDLQTREIAGGRFNAKGPWAKAWLPPGFQYETLIAAGKLEGPFTNLTHSGEIEATEVLCPGMNPVDIECHWQGKSIHSARAEIRAQAEGSILLLNCGVEAAKEGAEILLDNLALTTNAKPVLALTRPCRISITQTQRGRGWTFILPPLDLKGQAEVHAEASLHWPQEGMFRLEARNLKTTAVRAFAKADLDKLDIKTLNSVSAWSNGPAVFSLNLAAEALLDGGASNGQVLASALVHANGDGKGVAVSNLTLTSQTSTVAVAHGFIPLSFHPATPNDLVHFESETPLAFTAETQPQAFFWREISRRTGLVFDDPRLRLNLAGSWEEPQGEAHLQASRIQVRQKIPPLEKLSLDLQIDRQKARLSQGQFFIAGQPVTVGGELPLGQNFWNGLKQKRLPDWRQATAHLEVKDAAIASFAGLLPEVLSPRGQLNLRMSLLPEGRFEGELAVQHARTRPLGPLGPVRDINFRLTAHDQQLTLAAATAQVGGAPVQASGQVDLRGTNWLTGTLPPFEMKLRGTNVPLARQPEFIIRGDLDVNVAKTNGRPPVVSGTARVRNSFYLSDLSDLTGGKVASPSQRPPYFSIETPPFADWRLALHVTGDRALRVSSTLFNGEVSTSLHLEGTLKDPIALGDVKIDSGVVRFPFANFEVKQGLITLTSADPYRPHLLISATSKQFGYDLRMEATGTADAPILQFSCTPPLSSEQILLLVTAGQLPSGGYSLSTQQKAQTFGLFLGRDFLARLGFADQTQQRLIIHSAQEISETGKPTYSVEYKLNDRWSVVGERDRFGDFNAGVKCQVYSR